MSSKKNHRCESDEESTDVADLSTPCNAIEQGHPEGLRGRGRDQDPVDPLEKKEESDHPGNDSKRHARSSFAGHESVVDPSTRTAIQPAGG
jgi:hypothetical protein